MDLGKEKLDIYSSYCRICSKMADIQQAMHHAGTSIEWSAINGQIRHVRSLLGKLENFSWQLSKTIAYEEHPILKREVKDG